MKFARLKAVAHNIADSLASGVGLLIGVYQTYVFSEAAGEPEGFVLVDLLEGSTTAKTVSSDFRRAIVLYRDALPSFCAKHQVQVRDYRRLCVRYGTDRVYGPHFTVYVEAQNGRSSTQQYAGTPGRRLWSRRGAIHPPVGAKAGDA